MRVVIGSDHRGFALKENLKLFLQEKEIECIDVGTFSNEPANYPDVAIRAAEKVSSREMERGILICGTGIGMSIAANKFPGVRAALCYNPTTAKLSREHNDANILVLGGDIVEQDLARAMVEVWLTTDFSGGRHQKRLDKIREIDLYGNFRRS